MSDSDSQAVINEALKKSLVSIVDKITGLELAVSILAATHPAPERLKETFEEMAGFITGPDSVATDDDGFKEVVEDVRSMLGLATKDEG